MSAARPEVMDLTTAEGCVAWMKTLPAENLRAIAARSLDRFNILIVCAAEGELIVREAPPDPRNDWPVHRPAAWDAPIPGKHWAAGCEPGGDYDPETRSYAGSGPRVRPDGVCEGCGEAACPTCGHEVYDGECDCPPVTS